MKERYTIRPKARKGEALTGYIMRVAKANSVDFDLMFKSLPLSGKTCRFDRHDLSRIDILPNVITDVTAMCNLFGLDRNDLENLTFRNMLRDFIDDIDTYDLSLRNFLGADIKRYNRRFCPKCLKEHGYYKLIWQVSEISICIEHNEKLTTVCQHCLKEQPYYHSNLAQFKCVNCNRLLYDIGSENIMESEELNEQVRMYRDWDFLLSNKSKMFLGVREYSKRKSIAIKMLYVSRTEKDSRKPSAYKFLDSGYVWRIMRFINDGSNFEIIVLSILLKQLRKLNIELKEFFEIQVPELFINSIKPVSKNDIDIGLGECLSSWCKSYNCNANMIEVKGYRLREKKYRKASVCMDCLVPHGYNRKTGQWEEIGEYISLYWKIVRPKLEECLPKSRIYKELNIGEVLLDKAIGFLANQDLLSSTAKCNYIDMIVPSKIENHFEKLINMPGTLRKNASKVYKWRSIEFYYYFFNRKVQECIIFQQEVFGRKLKNKLDWEGKVKNSINKLIYNNIDISASNICKDIGCSYSTLKKEKLLNLIHAQRKDQQERRLKIQEQYLQAKVTHSLSSISTVTDQVISIKLIYELIGVRMNSMNKSNPSLVKWIRGKIIDFNKVQRARKEERLIEEIKNVINELYNQGDNVTINLISAQLGVNPYFIYKNSRLMKIYHEHREFVIIRSASEP